MILVIYPRIDVCCHSVFGNKLFIYTCRSFYFTVTVIVSPHLHFRNVQSFLLFFARVRSINWAQLIKNLIAKVSPKYKKVEISPSIYFCNFSITHYATLQNSLFTPYCTCSPITRHCKFHQRNCLMDKRLVESGISKSSKALSRERCVPHKNIGIVCAKIK